jgi:C4-dicarboxylate-specific signal transduction histidine kinase
MIGRRITGSGLIKSDDGSGECSSRIVRIQIAMDITEAKENEEERRRMEQQLIQAQKLEAIGTLAGGIAHDFNNLLMGIQGRASLMSINLAPDHPFRNM